MTFAGITLALVSGSIVERTKFLWWIIFGVLWLTFVYSPVAHWVWGEGWLAKMGALDFAGGTVVHINAGVSGLVLAILIGNRKGFGKSAFFPSSVLLTTLGAGLLWFGWFGFNAGSELAIDGVAVNAFIVTNTSGAVAALTWMIIEWIKDGKPTLLGIASGAIGGLAGITPASGYVNLYGALIIGIFAGIFGFYGVTFLKHKLGYDDSLDVFGVHGIDGIWGTLAAGLFADPKINGISGLFYGNSKQFIAQLIAVVVVIIFSVAGTLVLAYIAKIISGGWRVSEEEEVIGLDQSIHGEKSFELD
jgi:Amt family ammonium transporter